MHLTWLPYELLRATAELMDPVTSLALSAACSDTQLALKDMVAAMRRSIILHTLRDRLALTEAHALTCRNVFLRFAPGQHGVLCLSKSLPEMVRLSCAGFGTPAPSLQEMDAILKPNRRKRSIHIALQEFQEIVMRAKAHISVRDTLPIQLGEGELRQRFVTCAAVTPTEIDEGRSTGERMCAHDCFQALCTVALREATRPIGMAHRGFWS